MTTAFDRAPAGAFLPPPPLDTATLHSLDQQAFPFRQAGMEVAARWSAGMHLKTSDQRIRLGYRTQKHLLARIHHLQATTAVPGCGPGADCTLELHLRGTPPRNHWWKPSGPGEPEAAGIATRLTGPALTSLVDTVDLTSCTVSWNARTGCWHIRIEPYAGNHIRLLLPPMTYTNTVRPAEAETITAALSEITTAVAG